MPFDPIHLICCGMKKGVWKVESVLIYIKCFCSGEQNEEVSVFIKEEARKGQVVTWTLEVLNSIWNRLTFENFQWLSIF